MDSINHKLADLGSFFSSILTPTKEPQKIDTTAFLLSIFETTSSAKDLRDRNLNQETSDDLSKLATQFLQELEEANMPTPASQIPVSKEVAPQEQLETHTALLPAQQELEETSQVLRKQSFEIAKQKTENSALIKENTHLKHLLETQQDGFKQKVRLIQNNVTATLEEEKRTQNSLQEEVTTLSSKVNHLSKENEQLIHTNTQLSAENTALHDLLEEQQSLLTTQLRLHTSDYTSSDPDDTPSELSSEEDLPTLENEASDLKAAQDQLPVYKTLMSQIKSNLIEFQSHPNPDIAAFVNHLNKLLQQAPGNI